MDKQLLYFADPMCSWCWGFAPVIREVRRQFGGELPLRLILGGLAVGTDGALTETGKESIREHWHHVAELAGQAFDYGFFDRDGFVYDTEPPSRALVAMRRLQPNSAFDFLDRLHRAFYAENRDITDPAILAELAAEFGIATAAFDAAFAVEATSNELGGDFAITQQIGVRGFPALLAVNEDTRLSVITHGYQPWPKVEALITGWRDARPRAAV